MLFFPVGEKYEKKKFHAVRKGGVAESKRGGHLFNGEKNRLFSPLLLRPKKTTMRSPTQTKKHPF
jgi:hypothetical protein